MQRDPSIFDGKISSTDAYGVGDNAYNTLLGGHYTYGASAIPAFNASLEGTKHEFPSPLNGFEFQPSETCPKNFIIFDQTENKSRVMFHPALAQKLHSPSNFNDFSSHAHEGGKFEEKNNEYGVQFSSLKEDTEDINALLSSDDEEEAEDDDDDDDDEDDVVSTARTPTNWGGSNSPDSSCLAEGVKSHKLKSTSFHKSFSSSASSNSERKEKMKKMVKALRGIIPGGDRMDTPAVLDEAVRYLKSLKVEVKKLGIQNFED